MSLPPLIAAAIEATRESLAQMRARVGDVKYGPIADGVETVLFTFDGKPMQGWMRGRNRDLCIGFGTEQDRAICVRIILDGDAQPVTGTAAPAGG